MQTACSISRNGKGRWVVAVLIAACGCTIIYTQPQRDEGARRVPVTADGSLQNPAWSPENHQLLCTQFQGGYNVEPADLLIVQVDSGVYRQLVSDGSGNINLPGASWNAATRYIVFSSSREPHDEIFIVPDTGSPGDEQRVTTRENYVAYEPSFSPDGQWVVFESHPVDVTGNGVITKYRVDGSQDYVALTSPDDDCRQPNWSPLGNRIVYQRLADGQWDLWLINPDGTAPQQLTTGSGDKTDASFSPDGQHIVYSSDEGNLPFANLFVIPVSGGTPVRVTRYNGYDGAPSWSSDGTRIAFESAPGDPDESSGTTLWVIDAPQL